MMKPPARTPLRMIGAVLAAASTVSYAQVALTDAQRYETSGAGIPAYATDPAASSPGTASPSAWLVALEFATADDAQAFEDIAAKADALPPPDARSVARAFIREHLGIEGDDHFVAHFASSDDRKAGRPDQVVPLTEAVMEAFPDHSRHTTFAMIADGVGAVNGGGSASPSVVQLGQQLMHAGSAKEVFSSLGKFLWSRTGPGYLYNTLFARGNAIETVVEDYRSLDDAFGIYTAGGFTPANESPLRLSRLVDEFKEPSSFAELPYVKKLNGELDTYWKENAADWTVIARYRFVLQARLAHDGGLLNDDQYELVMRGGAPRVPLDGPVTMDQLRNPMRDGSVAVKRFDINGYTASDLLRFVAADGSEVMYVPGHDPAFVVAASETALREWVLAQARDPHELDALLMHFSIYNGQDGVFWTGVKHGLENVANGRWKADGRAIDHRNASIDGDVFEDMREVTKQRMRQDAGMQSSTAWQAWRTTVNRTCGLLAPLGFSRALTIPIQVGLAIVQTGTGTEQAIHGRTFEERKSGWEQVGLTLVTNTVLAGAFGQKGKGGVVKESVSSAERQPLLKPPQRVNGGIGYPLGPARAPGFPTEPVTRLYRTQTGALARWRSEDFQAQTLIRLPPNSTEVAPGIRGLGARRFVRMKGQRWANVVADGDGYRIRLRNLTAGPRIVRQRDGLWDLAFTDDNYVKGSILARAVDEAYTSYPDALHRGADILDQLGSSEAGIIESGRENAGPLAVLSTGHGVLETLSARLRNPAATSWTPRETELLAPSMAREVKRPIALYHDDGAFQFGVLADGSEFGAAQVPGNAIRLRLLNGRYVPFREHARTTGRYLSSVFHLVRREANLNPRNYDMDREFRRMLADAIDARSTSLELELIHKRWLDPMPIPEADRTVIHELSRLRHAVFTRHVGLTPKQVAMLRRADGARREALFPGERDPGPAFDDLMAKLARPEKEVTAAEAAYLTDLLVKVASEHDALLPRGLGHLSVKDPAVLAQAARERSDQWTMNGREYVRLRHLDGRVQVVETEPSRTGAYRQILAPGTGARRGTGRYVVDVDGRWLPEPGLRDGLALLPPVRDTEALVTIEARPSAEAEENFTIIEQMVNSIPQPLLRLVGTSLPAAEVAPNGAVEFSIRHPQSGRAMRFPTQLDAEGRPVPRERPATALPDISASSPDQHLVLPAPDRNPRPAAAADPAKYIGMLHAEQPISAFIEAGYGDRHIRTLVETRRLRGMLREDMNIAVVGATPEHVFTVVMPLNPETFGFVASSGEGGSLVGAPPDGTVIVDQLFGVRATVADYPSRVRAVAARWDAEGVKMRRIERDGTERQESPVAFIDRQLVAPVRPNLWNPEGDPISEVRYARYMRRRYEMNGPVRHAGLDWLETRKARRDYMTYFAPPYDSMPTWSAPPPTDLPATTMHNLVQTAIEVGALH